MGRKICPLCEHYYICKFWEILYEVTEQLEVEWFDERKFRKWRERFARFCMYFKLDKIELDSMHPSLDFLFHDFIIQSSKESASK